MSNLDKAKFTAIVSIIAIIVNFPINAVATESVYSPSAVSGGALNIEIETEDELEDIAYTEETEVTLGTEMDIEIASTVVSVSIPMNVRVLIDPNEKDGFLHSELEIANNTNAPVSVSVAEFEHSSAPFNEFIRPDELPFYLDWEDMSVSQTMRYFSLGLKPIDVDEKTWRSISTEDYIYLTDEISKETIGTLRVNESAYLSIKGYYGKSFKDTATFNVNVMFIAELIE